MADEPKDPEKKPYEPEFEDEKIIMAGLESGAYEVYERRNGKNVRIDTKITPR